MNFIDGPTKDLLKFCCCEGARELPLLPYSYVLIINLMLKVKKRSERHNQLGKSVEEMSARWPTYHERPT